MRHQVSSWALLAVGLTASVVGGYQLWSPTAPPTQPIIQAGVVPAAASAPAKRNVPAPVAKGSRRGVVENATRRTPPVARLPGPPAELKVFALGLRAAIDPVGVTAGGAVAIPPDVATVGWVATSGRPGLGHGTATIVGHVDDIHGHYGVLHRLYQAKIGQHVAIRTTTGETLGYVIRAIRLYPRNRLPADMFAQQGRPRLALVTCAGLYDHNRGGYQDNLIVWAVPSLR